MSVPPAACSIADGARLLSRHGGVVEVRMVKTQKGTVSGYFDNVDALVKAVRPWDGHANVYVTLNPVLPALLARATNRLKVFARETTEDKEILRRVWFPVDADPKRPAGISATQAELAAALARRDAVAAFLIDRGWPAGVTAMSGNGGHFLEPVDLPNDEPTKLLFQRALKALNERFSDNVVTIDAAVYNAARVWKLPGSWAVKGDPSADRPHRRATLESVPEPLDLVAREQLEELAAMLPAPRKSVSAPRHSNGTLKPIDLIEVFREREAYIKPLGDQKHAVTCCWVDEHSVNSGPSETVIWEPATPGEPWRFKCQHSHCSERTIKDVISFFGLKPSSNGHTPPRQTHAPKVVAGSEPEAAEDEPEDFTEDELALEFTDRYGNDLLYVHLWGQWFRWDGQRWAHEHTLKVYDLARSLVREKGARIDEDDLKLKAKVKSAKTVNAIVSLARSDRAHARTTKDFDADIWALNTPANTSDLRSGARRVHRREDHITKITPVAPSNAAATLWQECLRTWTKKDDELIAFLQRLCGYWTTGAVTEEKLVIIYGPGGNGKTKFIETVRGCLGHDYATGMAMETLMATYGEQHPTDLADLFGKRLAIAMETEEGRRLAESKIKGLTGGDRVRARHMRQDFFEFAPTHKIVIVGNHRPTLRNVDEAMRRRLILIPFDAQIPKQDKDLATKLVAEYPAILGWMIEGARLWLDQGLNPPKSVLAATQDYLESSDAMGRWLAEKCVIGPTQKVTRAAAFKSWRTWAEKAGEYVGSPRRLAERIRTIPGVEEETSGDRRWIQVGLKPEPADDGSTREPGDEPVPF